MQDVSKWDIVPGLQDVPCLSGISAKTQIVCRMYLDMVPELRKCAGCTLSKWDIVSARTQKVCRMYPV